MTTMTVTIKALRNDVIIPETTIFNETYEEVCFAKDETTNYCDVVSVQKTNKNIELLLQDSFTREIDEVKLPLKDFDIQCIILE